jgi:hypothetical protein
MDDRSLAAEWMRMLSDARAPIALTKAELAEFARVVDRAVAQLEAHLVEELRSAKVTHADWALAHLPLCRRMLTAAIAARN